MTTCDELGNIGLAQRDDARGLHPFHDEIVEFGHVVLVDPGTEGCPDSHGEVVIFVGDGNSVERAVPPAGCKPLIGGCRLLHRSFRKVRHDGVDVGVDLIDALEMRRHGFSRRELSCTHQLRQLRRAAVVQRLRHGRPSFVNGHASGVVSIGTIGRTEPRVRPPRSQR